MVAIPKTRFSHMHIYIIGLLPLLCEGYTHLLTMIDRSNRWPEAFLLRETTAETLLDAFVATWVARFGVPTNITSRQGCPVHFYHVDCLVWPVWGATHP